MFTGLVEKCAQVVAAEGQASADATQPLRLTVQDPWAHLPRMAESRGAAAPDALRPSAGDSVAVDGVCLTVVAPPSAAAADAQDRYLRFDVGHETLLRTTLGTLQPGQNVHLERALAYGARVGGHLVSGHVDAVGTVCRREMRGSSLYLGLEVPPAVAQLSAAQGSVTLAGVSLTLTQVEQHTLWVCLIPHTLAVTHLGTLEVGDRVNCEADLLARYLQRLLRAQPNLGAGHAL